jgi:hypothetical protein
MDDKELNELKEYRSLKQEERVSALFKQFGFHIKNNSLNEFKEVVVKELDELIELKNQKV